MERIKKYKGIILAILLAIVIEIFICNYGFFRTLFCTNGEIANAEYTKVDNHITIADLDTRVTSINIEYQEPLNTCITYQVFFYAEENDLFLRLNPKTILKNDKQEIQLDTHTKCKRIEIELTGQENLEIASISLNKPNLRINILRILFLFVVILLLGKIKDGAIFHREYDPTSNEQNRDMFFVLAVLCFVVTLYLVFQAGEGKMILKPDEIDPEDSLLMQTEAFVHGKAKLLVEPSEELKNLEDPYNPAQRSAQKADYLFDVAYYNGAYYNYFGLTPILTSILPFRLVTGCYLQTYIFNLFYMIIAIFALCELYKKLIKRYLKKISIGNFYLGYFAILLASNFFMLLVGRKYDIVISSGIVFLLLSLNLALSIRESKKSLPLKLVLLGITSALVVLSKPNFIVYYPLILFFLWESFREQKGWKEKTKYLSYLLIPLGIFAIFQMGFNAIRFGNVLEFGAKYQLTEYNMTACMGITFGKIYEGLVGYLAYFPTVEPFQFPIITLGQVKNPVIMNELCYKNQVLGLFAIPLLYSLFFVKSILKKPEEKELKHFIILCLILTAMAIIITTCCAGIAENYSIDFKMLLATCAVFVFLKGIEASPTPEMANRIFRMVCLVTIFEMAMLALSTGGWITDMVKPISVFLKNTFEFWR